MGVIFLGFVFLVAAVFPAGDALISPRYTGSESFLGLPVKLLIIKPLITYTVAFILVTWFLLGTKLAKRLSTKHPGIGLLKIGVAINVAFLLLNATSFTYFYAHLASFPGGMVVFYIPQLLLLIGAVKLLLNAQPLQENM
ncbi:hypothetical protein ACN9MJ_14915 [Acidovorax facilis]|uniref:hypothetical protein n=1 Tax=Acidovorax facilis TaxID=12917 RepID=UPI003CE84246